MGGHIFVLNSAVLVTLPDTDRATKLLSLFYCIYDIYVVFWKSKANSFGVSVYFLTGYNTNNSNIEYITDGYIIP